MSRNDTQALAPILAKPGDPLVLGKDQVYYEDADEQLTPQAPIDHRLTALTFKASKRRSIQELQAKPNVYHAIAAVMLYTFLGVSERDICVALNISVGELLAVRKHPAYSESFDRIVNEIINANSNFLTARLAAHSLNAVDNIVRLAGSAKAEAVKLSANKEILGHAGITPKETASRQSNSSNELRIVITDGDKNIGLELNGVKIGE